MPKTKPAERRKRPIYEYATPKGVKRWRGPFEEPLPGTPFIAIGYAEPPQPGEPDPKRDVPIYTGTTTDDPASPYPWSRYSQAGTLHLSYAEWSALIRTLEAGSDVMPVGIGGLNVRLTYLEPRSNRK